MSSGRSRPPGQFLVTVDDEVRVKDQANDLEFSNMRCRLVSELKVTPS